MAERQKTIKKPFSGYHKYNGPVDTELTQVGPDTPGGEYLRRFWHPVELSANVKDLPIALKILGEDLVLFRDKRGKLGLLDRYCAHRNASLEYGRVTDRGIQCCYHGWHFGADGTILETPLEPDGNVCGRVFQGAYPVVEKSGLVFAYMGPPEKRPEFPNFDFFDEFDEDKVLYKRFSPCNWIQTRDNEVDNAHAYFLHVYVDGIQLTSAHATMAKCDYVESPLGIVTVQSRRVNENIFIRLNTTTLPNITRVSTIDDGAGEVLFDRRGPIIQWAVPIDDENTVIIGWNAIAKNLPDAKQNALMDREVRAGKNLHEHPQLNFVFGQDGSRPYEDRQRSPGDWDAWVSQGPIHVTANDHLVKHDQGVVMFHRMLLEGIRAVKEGRDPKGLIRGKVGRIETYASNTSQRVPRPATQEQDDRWIAQMEREVIAKTFDGTYPQGYKFVPEQESVAAK